MTATLRERRAEKRRVEILEAALDVFTEEGYTNASMDRIAERALLTRVGLYKHFRDKAALVAALRGHKLLELTGRVREAIAGQRGFEAQVRAIVFETARYQTEHRGFFRVLLASSFASEAHADGALLPYLHLLAEVIASGLGLTPDQAVENAGVLASLAFMPSIKSAFIPLPPDYAPAPEMLEHVTNVYLLGALRARTKVRHR